MAGLWVPASACPHPPEAIFGALDAPKGFAVMCRHCGGAWDETTAPENVVDSLYKVLAYGYFKPLNQGWESS